MSGFSSWPNYCDYPIWLAGKELNNAGRTFISPVSHPGVVSGVDTQAGHVGQSGGASPKAPVTAGQRDAFSLGFRPALDRIATEHVLRLTQTQRQGPPLLWLPIPWVETWQIRDVERNTWTLSGTISGDSGDRGSPPGHITPTVEISDASGVIVATTAPADWPGATTLTLVTIAPAADTEIQIPTATDTTALVTGDLTSYAGGSLSVRYWGTKAVELQADTLELEEINRLIVEFEVVTKAPQIDYEADS